jgi:hypothetical protein
MTIARSKPNVKICSSTSPDRVRVPTSDAPGFARDEAWTAAEEASETPPAVEWGVEEEVVGCKLLGLDELGFGAPAAYI